MGLLGSTSSIMVKWSYTFDNDLLSFLFDLEPSMPSGASSQSWGGDGELAIVLSLVQLGTLILSIYIIS